MIGFRVSSFAAICAVVLAWPVSAEDIGPASAPPKGLSTAVPVKPAPVSEPEDVESTLPDQVGRPQGPKVTVSKLSAVDPSGAGLLNASSGGYPGHLWARSQKPVIANRIAALHATPSSPVMQSMMRKLLLTAAAPPSGDTEPGEPTLLAQRLRKIFESGRLPEAAKLGAQSANDDDGSRQVWAAALLLQEREDELCADNSGLRATGADAFWLKVRVLCHIVEGNTTAAQFTLDIMRERSLGDDTFFALGEAAIDGKAKPIKIMETPGAVELKLARMTGSSVPASAAHWLPAHNVFRLSAVPGLKLIAADQAGSAGLLGPEELRAVYEAEIFSADELGDPEDFAPKMAVARGNALYFQAIAQRTSLAAKASAFAAALERADSQNRFGIFAEMVRPIARTLPVTTETAWLGPHIVRVLLYNGDVKTVNQWTASLVSPTDAPVLNAIQIHAALAYPSTENLAKLQTAISWLGTNAQAPGGLKDWLMARALREIPLLDAMGYTIPPEAQWAVAGQASAIPPGGIAAEALSSIASSAQQGRIGETVLNALVVLGSNGPARTAGKPVARVVDALATLGLRDEARALAAEAVLGVSMRRQK